MNKEKYLKYYDLIMGGLAIIVVAILMIEMTMTVSINVENILILIDNVIWIIFCIDYFTRLVASKKKWVFFKKNIVDLVSIIPFNSLFKALRVVKIFRVVKLARLSKLVRVTVLMAKFKLKINRFLETNNFIYAFTIATVFGGAVFISIVEKMKFVDALWWSFVTTTTVGYGDISPTTSLGRIIAVVLMIVGIGFIGMLTGTIATFFIKNK